MEKKTMNRQQRSKRRNNFFLNSALLCIIKSVKMELSTIEYESSFSIKILESDFNDLKLGKTCKKVFVMYYKNGTRISGNLVQYKKNVSRPSFILKRYHNHFIPWVRSVCSEDPAPLDINFLNITTIVVRYILYENDGIRIALERRLHENGGDHYLCGEIEYIESVTTNYAQLLEHEDWLLNALDVICPKFHFDYELNYRQNDEADVPNITSRTFHKFANVNPRYDPVMCRFKYKFDGYKGRMFTIKKDMICYYDDMHNLLRINSPILNHLPNIIVQTELMAKQRTGRRSTIILTDIIGAYVGRRLYIPEPLAVLDYFAECMSTDMILNMGPLGPRTMTCQRAIDLVGESVQPTELKHDGYLFVYQNMEFKYKIPTIDVRIESGTCFLGNSTDVLTMIPNWDPKNPNGIYEVGPMADGHLQVYRRRLDRTQASTDAEYAEYTAEVEFFRDYLNIVKGNVK